MFHVKQSGAPHEAGAAVFWGADGAVSRETHGRGLNYWTKFRVCWFVAPVRVGSAPYGFCTFTFVRGVLALLSAAWYPALDH